jgi:hypothetical protein
MPRTITVGSCSTRRQPDRQPPLGQRWLDWGLGIPSGANTNYLYLTEGLLGPYTAKTMGIYKCPADKVPCPLGPRVRSVSMNTYLARKLDEQTYQPWALKKTD